MAAHRPASGIDLSGLGDTQRRLLELLKREGEQGVGRLARSLGLADETVRGHLNALAGRGLVERAGRRKEGPGRPEILFGLTDRAEALFPSEEGTLLRELTAYLLGEGEEGILEAFFRDRTSGRREEARDRLRGLSGRERLEEVATILSEEGFMAEVVDPDGDDGEGALRLRLCHCPLKEMVAVSRLPCHAEEAWIGELLGVELARTSWMPEGDRTCCYEVG